MPGQKGRLPEASLLAHTKFGGRLKFRPDFRLLAALDACMFYD